MARRIWLSSLGTVAAVLLSMVLTYFLMIQIEGHEEFLHDGIILAAIVPLLVAFPICYYGVTKQEKIQSLLDQVAAMNAELEIRANTDAMTGLLNRRAFLEKMEAHLDETQAGAVFFVDVDHFKKINDTFGHDSGDQALVLIADALSESVRSHGYVGRLGGEEFAVFAQATDVALARALAERLRMEIASLNFEPRTALRHPLSVSVGVTLADQGEETREVLQRADSALYSAKQTGRNRVVFYPAQSDMTLAAE